MTARCEPPPELRGVDGWHWVQPHDWEPIPARWHAAENAGNEPRWTSSHHVPSGTPAWAYEHWGWRYLSPVATPAEVEALRAAVDAYRQTALDEMNDRQKEYDRAEALKADAAEWRRLCFIAEPEMAAMRTELMRAGAECADAMAQVATLRARVAELLGALVLAKIFLEEHEGMTGLAQSPAWTAIIAALSPATEAAPE